MLSTSDRLSVMSSFSSGHSLAALLTSSGGIVTAGILTGPVAVLLGVGLGGFYAFESFRSKRKQLFAGEFTSWMRNQCEQSQLAIRNSFSLAMIDLQEEVRALIRDALVEREHAIASAVASAKAAVEHGESGRRSATEQIDRRLAAVSTARAEGEHLLQALAADRRVEPAAG
jgi:hypothetical protein